MVSTNAQPQKPAAYHGDVFASEYALAAVLVHEVAHTKQAQKMTEKEWNEAISDPKKVEEMHEEVAKYEQDQYRPKP